MSNGVILGVAYVWLISIIGAVYFGHEIAMASTRPEMVLRALLANEKIRQCNEVIAGELGGER